MVFVVLVAVVVVVEVLLIAAAVVEDVLTVLALAPFPPFAELIGTIELVGAAAGTLEIATRGKLELVMLGRLDDVLVTSVLGADVLAAVAGALVMS